MPIILSQFSILIIVRICGFHRETMFTFHYPWNQDTANVMRFHKHGAEIIVGFCISLTYVLHWISHFIRYIKYVSVDMTVSKCIIERVFKGKSVKSFKLADLKRDFKSTYRHMYNFSHIIRYLQPVYAVRGLQYEFYQLSKQHYWIASWHRKLVHASTCRALRSRKPVALL